MADTGYLQGTNGPYREHSTVNCSNEVGGRDWCQKAPARSLIRLDRPQALREKREFPHACINYKYGMKPRDLNLITIV